MPVDPSILKATKKVIHIGDDDPSFDYDIIMFINGAFSTLHDLGLGPEAGFVIEDEAAKWDDFETETIKQSKIQTYVFLRVRLLFDPPETSYAIAALEKQLEEVSWRLNVNREESDWVHPDPAPVMVIDGGDPTGP